jgi:glycosyltransferase involved in cell wall biosynthesis
MGDRVGPVKEGKIMGRLDQTGRTVIQVYGGRPEKHGSIEDYFVLLTRTLRERGYRNLFVFDKAPNANLSELYRTAGAEIVVLPPPRNRRFDLEAMRSFYRLFREIKPEVVHCHFGYFDAAVAARLAGIRNVVWTKHTFQGKGAYYRRVHPLKTFFSTIFLMGLVSKKVISVSERGKKELLLYHVPASKIERVYLGIDLLRFSHQEPLRELRRELGVSDEERLITCISHARPEKGLEYLVRAASEARKKRKDFKVLIVGGGPLTENLRALAAKLSLGETILFGGIRNDVERILAVSDFTVLPSLNEGLPLVSIESLAAGKPIIATNVAGNAEVVIDGKTGFLVMAADYEALSERIVTLLSNTDLLKTMAQCCREKSLSFDVKSGVAETLRVYGL